jgi:galactonate dehydratase
MRVKITAVTTRVVNAEMRNWVFVKVETDQPGLFGWGEATLEWKTRAVVGAVEDLAPLLLGRDPRDIEQAVRVMKKHSFWRLGVIGMSAVSGIEVALWDIAGKLHDVPVWRLLGGKVRDRVKVYTHLGLGDMRAVYESMEQAPLVERAQQVVAKGYRAFKAVFVPYTHYHAPAAEVAKVERLMAALRAAVGPERRRGTRLPRSAGARKTDVRGGSVAAGRNRSASRGRGTLAGAARDRRAAGRPRRVR